MKVKCKYCGIVKYVPPSQVKSKENYFCGSDECKKKNMAEIGKKNTQKKDFSQLKKLNGFAKMRGHEDLFMSGTRW